MATRGLGESLHKKRLFLEKQLMDVGFRVLPAQGTYFLVADFRYVRGRFTCSLHFPMYFCYGRLSLSIALHSCWKCATLELHAPLWTQIACVQATRP
jgi:hypothetical protein